MVKQRTVENNHLSCTKVIVTLELLEFSKEWGKYPTGGASCGFCLPRETNFHAKILMYSAFSYTVSKSIRFFHTAGHNQTYYLLESNLLNLFLERV